MNPRAVCALAALNAVFASGGALAQVNLNKLAQSTMNFQLVNLSARASAMGEASYAISAGSESIFSNPAGIVESKRDMDVNLSYVGWVADIRYLAGAFTWNLGNYGTVGVSGLSVDYGTIHATRLVARGQQALFPDGYEDIGEMSNVAAYSVGVSYAKAISSQFSIGGTMRYTGQNLGESLLANGLKKNNAARLVFDAGVKYKTGFRSFRFGMAIRNFSSQIKHEEIEEQLPLTFTLGAAMDLLDFITPDHSEETNLTLGVDYLHSNNYSERINLGAEYLFMGTVALRAGYQTNRDIASWSAGIGLTLPVEDYGVQLDYSFSRFQYFTGVHRMSVGFSF